MRRRFTLRPGRFSVLPATVVLAVPLLAAGACSGEDDIGVAVKGDFGSRPDVSFPKEAPGGKLAVKTVTEGAGTEAGKGDLVVADYVGYRWSKDGNKLLANSFLAGRPGAFPTGRLVPGLEKALEGARVGDRVVAKIPPGQGYGTKGSSQHQVGAGDTLLYVLDVRAVYSRTAVAKGAEQPLNDAKLPRVGPVQAGQGPSVTIPKGVAASRTLQVRTLVQGEGKAIGQGRLLALQYVGVFWRDGKAFDSSWKAGRPYAATIGTGQVMKGWDQALVGQKVGSRLLLVVPPSVGYGTKGLAQAGIKGDDTLVFVVDVLGAH